MSFTLVMLAIAAAVALALGLVGIYGVISYIVSQRTREIGVRMALGADRRDVRRMVLRQGVILAGIGVAVGLVVAVGLTRLMSSLLYGVEATDPVTFGVVAAPADYGRSLRLVSAGFASLLDGSARGASIRVEDTPRPSPSPAV